MEFIDPTAFAVQYKSRYVPKPVEAVAAMTDTFNKRYEDAVASGDIMKQAYTAAKPATSAMQSEMQRLYAESKQKLDAAIAAGDIRQVDLTAKSLATDFASDPRVSLIAQASEQIRAQEMEKLKEQALGNRVFVPTVKNADGTYAKISDYDNFLPYTTDENGRLAARPVPSIFNKQLNWEKAATMDLNPDSNQNILKLASASGADAQTLAAARGMLESKTTEGISADKVMQMAKIYAPVFASSPEGSQYIATVRTGQAEPIGLTPEQAAKLSDNDLAALFVAHRNMPQVYDKVSRDYITTLTGESSSGGNDGPDEILASLDYISGQSFNLGTAPKFQDPKVKEAIRTANINALNLPPTAALGLKIFGAITGLLPSGDTSPNQKTNVPLRQKLDEKSRTVYDAIASFSGLDPESPETEKIVKGVVEGGGSATDFIMYGNTKTINNQTGVHFTNDGYLKKTGVLKKVGDSKPLADAKDIQKELNKDKGNKPEVIGKAAEGTDLSFYGGAVIQSGADKYVLEPNMQEQRMLYNRAKASMVSNVVEKAVSGQLPYMKHKLGDSYIEVIARKEGNTIFADVDEGGKKSTFRLVINSDGTAQYVQVK